MSPSRFIQTTKIKQAERLLITTDMTVSEIADKTGYSSSYYMSKVFKDFYDTSPTGYRKSFIKY
jgi:AraC-like DNA-binding protein